MSILETFFLLQSYLDSRNISCTENTSKDFLQRVSSFKKSLLQQPCPKNPKNNKDLFNYFHCKQKSPEDLFNDLKNLLPFDFNLDCSIISPNISGSDSKELIKNHDFFKKNIIDPIHEGRNFFKNYNCLVFSLWKEQLDSFMTQASLNRNISDEISSFLVSFQKKEFSEKNLAFQVYFNNTCMLLKNKLY